MWQAEKMAVCNTRLWRVCTGLFLLWIWVCDTQYQAEEEEIFHSDKEVELKWSSEPSKEWNEIRLGQSTKSAAPVLQACGRGIMRTILSKQMERKDAHYLLMDITFAQEEESSVQLSQLKVHLFDLNIPITRFQNSGSVVDLQTSRPFPRTVTVHQMSDYLNRTLALNLGPVSQRGFQLAFSYSGTCVLVTSIRLYYRKCPDIDAQLSFFKGTGAGSGPLMGSCVKGAVVLSPPLRECDMDGVWGPLRGECACEPGHQAINVTCQACHMGYYKPANESGGCRLCPANSRTHKEGSVRCDCLQGFNRLPVEPDDLGCTKPPSAPVNLTAHHYNDSVLIVTWDPPHDLGGRQEVTYQTKCEKEAEDRRGWMPCGDDVVVLSDSEGLTSTSVSITGLNPQHNYRLSVQAWNDVSNLLGGPVSSTVTVTIQRWKVPPEVIIVTPTLNISEATPVVHHQSWSSTRLTAGVLGGIMLLIVVVLVTVYVLRHNYSLRRSEAELDLLPQRVVFSYRRPQEVEAASQQPNMVEGVAQLLGGISGRLLASLKEVLVERNKLTLGKELGKGEFGSVYEGVFTSADGVDIKVAVKTMRVGIHSQGDLHQFLREAELMQSFDHENVVKLLVVEGVAQLLGGISGRLLASLKEVLVERNKLTLGKELGKGVTLQREQDCPLPVPLVILPYMKHGDLRRFLIDTRYGDVPMFVPHQTLLRFMIDIAAGMDYLSSQGFLHRDLAARNCMLDDDLRVCVADFGLSKKIYSSNYYRQNVATRLPIKWLAMESLSESVYTTKSDVWSFGVTMWEIVSRGRTPYPGVHNCELLDLLLSGHRLKPPTDCDHKLYKIMQSCWNKEPAHRPGFRELGETLKGLLSELPALEASQEANYINQVLEVSATATAFQDPQTDSGERWENVYLPTPVGAGAARNEDVEVEDGYLKYITGSAVKGKDH